MPARRTIDDVLRELNAIVDDSVEHGGRIGYFTALYARVTSNVRRAILAGRVFDDDARMERLDVVFADRFLDAWRARREGKPLTRSWRQVFEALDDPGVLVIQHLLMGMTAHIRLDLGVAAAEVGVTPEGLRALHADFLRINDVLARLVGVVEAQIQTFSPRLGRFTEFAPHLQRRIFDFGMESARDEAWELARALVDLPLADRPRRIHNADERVACQIREIHPVAPALDPVVRWIHDEERKLVRFNVQVLAS